MSSGGFFEKPVGVALIAALILFIFNTIGLVLDTVCLLPFSILATVLFLVLFGRRLRRAEAKFGGGFMIYAAIFLCVLIILTTAILSLITVDVDLTIVGGVYALADAVFYILIFYIGKRLYGKGSQNESAKV